jgi:hypothetical protein
LSAVQPRAHGEVTAPASTTLAPHGSFYRIQRCGEKEMAHSFGPCLGGVALR